MDLLFSTGPFVLPFTGPFVMGSTGPYMSRGCCCEDNPVVINIGVAINIERNEKEPSWLSIFTVSLAGL